MALFGREMGSKPGGGQLATVGMDVTSRKERIQNLTLKGKVLENDPYYFKNHRGQIECKLCGTLHLSTSSYLAHLNGKRHVENIRKRNAMIALREGTSISLIRKVAKQNKTDFVGTPSYKIIKQRDIETKKQSIVIEIICSRILPDIHPIYRIMSAFEQNVEKPNDNYLYFIIAAKPYRNICIKIPKGELDEIKESWNDITKEYIVIIPYK